MIYEHEGKKYIRMGECNNCGECCIGWINPCPNLEFQGNITSCKIHDKLADKDDEEVKAKCNVKTTACSNFPVMGDLNFDSIRNKCGYYFMEVEKILVACPVHECKEYSFQRWIDNVKQLTYPLFDIFVVDNSPNENFINRYKDQIPMVHLPDTNQDGNHYHERITKSMTVIQKYFLSGDYSRWFNLECDIIPPKDIIEFLLYWGRNTDWISHCYEIRQDDTGNIQQGIGCSMLSRRMAEYVDYEKADSPDAWLWEEVRKAERFHTMELWQYIKIEHLRQ